MVIHLILRLLRTHTCMIPYVRAIRSILLRKYSGGGGVLGGGLVDAGWGGNPDVGGGMLFVHQVVFG